MSRIRSSASSRCWVSRAWRWRIALASPATVWAEATSGWRPAAARISDAGIRPSQKSETTAWVVQPSATWSSTAE